MGQELSSPPRYYADDAMHIVQSDDDLMAAFRAGRREAFDELFERYREPVWGYFRRRAGDPARAEELAQDVFVAVLDGARRYEPRGAFRSYLFGIAFRTLGTERRVLRADGPPIDLSAPSSDPTSVMWVR